MAAQTNTRFAVAVHVLSYLAGNGGGRLIGSDELAASVNANPVHVRRVLGPLREAGVLRSCPGAQGGWQLVRDPAELTLGEVWRLVQSDDPIIGVHDASPACPVGRHLQGRLTALDRDLQRAVEAQLERTTVADLRATATVPTG